MFALAVLLDYPGDNMLYPSTAKLRVYSSVCFATHIGGIGFLVIGVICALRSSLNKVQDDPLARKNVRTIIVSFCFTGIGGT